MLRKLLGDPEAVRPLAEGSRQEGPGSSAPAAPLLHFGLCKVRQRCPLATLHKRAAVRGFAFTARVFLALAGVGLRGADGGGPPHPAAAAGGGGATVIPSVLQHLRNRVFYASRQRPPNLLRFMSRSLRGSRRRTASSCARPLLSWRAQPTRCCPLRGLLPGGPWPAQLKTLAYLR